MSFHNIRRTTSGSQQRSGRFKGTNNALLDGPLQSNESAKIGFSFGSFFGKFTKGINVLDSQICLFSSGGGQKDAIPVAVGKGTSSRDMLYDLALILQQSFESVLKNTQIDERKKFLEFVESVGGSSGNSTRKMFDWVWPQMCFLVRST